MRPVCSHALTLTSADPQSGGVKARSALEERDKVLITTWWMEFKLVIMCTREVKGQTLDLPSQTPVVPVHSSRLSCSSQLAV